MGGRGVYASNTFYSRALKLSKGNPNDEITKRAKNYIQSIKEIKRKQRQGAKNIVEY